MKPERWIKKGSTVEVEAVRVNEDNVAEVAAWCDGTLIDERDPVDGEEQKGINLFTPEGMQRASYHMYVIRWGRAFFVQHPRVFEDRYQPKDRDPEPPESIGDTRRRLGFGPDPSGGYRL